MDASPVLNQVFQPYFYFTLLLLIACYSCVFIFTKLTQVGRQTRSLLYLLPLIVPTLVFIVFPPQISLTQIAQTEIKPQTVQWITLSGSPFTTAPAPVTLTLLSLVNVPSITGYICIIGLSLGISLLIFQFLLSDKVLRRIYRFINAQAEEYPELQNQVKEYSKKLSLKQPKICLIEDLRPNAFTMGYGRRSTIVFSTGLLEAINGDELAAVVCHELAHLRNHDFFFKAFTSALTTFFFYNPLAYFASSAAQRERELLADENGAKQLKNPNALVSALVKINQVFKSLPKERFSIRLTTNLLVTSSLLRRPTILSSHPQINQRLRNITSISPQIPKAQFSPKKAVCAIILITLLLFASLMAVYYLAGFQSDYLDKNTKISFLAASGFKLTNLTSLQSGNSTIQPSPVAFNSTLTPVFSLTPASPVLNHTISSLVLPTVSP
jgi:Zn-dependent protease with chaperone function